MMAILKGIGAFFAFIRAFVGTILSILFLFLVVVTINAMMQSVPSVPSSAALVIAPVGPIVEQAPSRTPNEVLQDALTGQRQNRLMTLKEVLDALELAKEDSRIKAVVLNFDRFSGAGPSKLHRIGQALDDFKESGKKVIAIGSGYGQSGYLIASHASEVYIHPFGGVVLEGYGIYRTFLGGFLDSFSVTRYLWKIGDYKSAADTLVRSDMAPLPKQAWTEVFGDLWQEYQTDVEQARGLNEGSVDAYAQSIAQLSVDKKGDLATVALEAGLIDGVMDKNEQRQLLIEIVGEDEKKKTFKQIGVQNYLAASASEQRKPERDNRIAVITAAGAIVDGEAPAGTAGGDTIARLIRKARTNEKVKAIVLRVDSGGGSAFASEVIRRELVLAREENGKTVVASFGSIAASGGYWISATSDKIYAPRSTITGSIGILTLLMTFEKTGEQFDIAADGVGTTPLTSASNPFLPLSEDLQTVVSESIKRGYEEFLTIVSAGRNMPRENVHALAQGRVWSSVDAKEAGLIDEFGYLDDAIAGAAELAGLSDFSTMMMQQEQKPINALINKLSSSVMAWFVGETPKPALSLPPHVQAIVDDASSLQEFNDPNGLHAVCVECRAFETSWK